MNKRGKSSEIGGIGGLIGIAIMGIILIGVSGTDTTGLLAPIGIFLVVMGGIGLVIYFIKMATR